MMDSDISLKEDAGPPNFEYNEMPVEAKIDENRKSLDEIKKIAKEIFTKVRKVGDDYDNEKLLEDLQKEYKDFNHSFPIVLRWMVVTRRFYMKAFDKYLKIYSAKISAGIKTKDEYLELLAKYPVCHEKEANPKYDNKQMQVYHKQIIQQLQEEHKEFEKMQKEAEEEIRKKDEKINEERKKTLYEMLMKQKVERERQMIK